MNKETFAMIERVKSLGISEPDAWTLRRISMTLSRWFELECGDGNEYGSWAIERDDNGDGPPYFVHHHYMHGSGKDYTTRTRIADRETGARKRLAAIMDRYPRLTYYVQTDPRGASLYIIKRSDLEGNLIVEKAVELGFTYKKVGEEKPTPTGGRGAAIYQSAQTPGYLFSTPEQGALRFFKVKNVEPPKSRNLPVEQHYTRGIAVYK